jgi:hypothetical protein
MADIPAELIHQADGLLSLVAYRYPSALPADLVQELKETSWALRRALGEEADHE